MAGFGEQGVAGQAFAPLPGVVEVAGAEGGAGGHGEGVGVFVDGGGGVGGAVVRTSMRRRAAAAAKMLPAPLWAPDRASRAADSVTASPVRRARRTARSALVTVSSTVLAVSAWRAPNASWVTAASARATAARAVGAPAARAVSRSADFAGALPRRAAAAAATVALPRGA